MRWLCTSLVASSCLQAAFSAVVFGRVLVVFFTWEAARVLVPFFTWEAASVLFFFNTFALGFFQSLLFFFFYSFIFNFVFFHFFLYFFCFYLILLSSYSKNSNKFLKFQLFLVNFNEFWSTFMTFLFFYTTGCSLRNGGNKKRSNEKNEKACKKYSFQYYQYVLCTCWPSAWKIHKQ